MRESTMRTPLLSVFTLVLLPVCVVAQDMTKLDLSRAGNDKVRQIMKTYGGRGVMADSSQPTPATKAVGEFKMRDGFEMQLVAAEPDVSQPLFFPGTHAGACGACNIANISFQPD